jgi:hypothetical protein
MVSDEIEMDVGEGLCDSDKGIEPEPSEMDFMGSRSVCACLRNEDVGDSDDRMSVDDGEQEAVPEVPHSDSDDNDPVYWSPAPLYLPAASESLVVYWHG